MTPRERQKEIRSGIAEALNIAYEALISAQFYAPNTIAYKQNIEEWETIANFHFNKAFNGFFDLGYALDHCYLIRERIRKAANR